MAKILLIEDSIFQVRAFENMLQGLFEFHHTGTNQAAVKMLDMHRDFELIIVDYFLPDGDCLNLVREIRSRPEYESTPVILISTSLNKQVIHDAISAGVNDCVRKPIKPVLFMELLQTMLTEPYQLKLDYELESIHCFSWLKDGVYYQYCPLFNKREDGDTPEEAFESMHEFLARQITPGDTRLQIEEASISIHMFEFNRSPEENSGET